MALFKSSGSWGIGSIDGLDLGFSLRIVLNSLNAELNPIYHLLALLGAHHILHVSRIRVKCSNISVDRTGTIFGVTDLVQDDAGLVRRKNCVRYVEYLEGVVPITAKEIGKRGQDFLEPTEDKIPKNRPFLGGGPAWYVEVTLMVTFHITFTIKNVRSYVEFVLETLIFAVKRS